MPEVRSAGSTAPPPDVAASRRHPEWIKARIPAGEEYQEVRRLLHGLTLHTVCEEARCPNLGECWAERTATVMILGDVCTRSCGFCAVATGRPAACDPDEPRRVAEAIRGLGLAHVVVTSVARDDLADGGASVFAETIRRLRDACPGMGVEVLIPDFNGQEEPLRAVMEAGPDILNHNLETVERLQKPVRRRARYDRSLEVLARAKAIARELGAAGTSGELSGRPAAGGPRPAPGGGPRAAPGGGRPAAVHTKSSIMVGLGETREELRQAFEDLRAVDCDILTLGQYLRPTADHLAVERYYRPEEFDEMREEALALGFLHVESGPLVRSSYRARYQVPGAPGGPARSAGSASAAASSAAAGSAAASSSAAGSAAASSAAAGSAAASSAAASSAVSRVPAGSDKPE